MGGTVSGEHGVGVGKIVTQPIHPPPRGREGVLLSFYSRVCCYEVSTIQQFGQKYLGMFHIYVFHCWCTCA
jgi:hypothetical protein